MPEKENQQSYTHNFYKLKTEAKQRKAKKAPNSSLVTLSVRIKVT